MNDIMDRVEKDAVPLGGDFPLNAAYMQNLEKYFTKGEILEAYGGEKYKGASGKQEFQYYIGDPVWLQLKQMDMQTQMAQQQQQQAAAQGQQPPGADGQPQPGQPGGPDDLSQGQDLDSAVQQLGQSLTKSEKKLPINRRQLLAKHKAAKSKIMGDFRKETQSMMDSIMGALGGKN